MTTSSPLSQAVKKLNGTLDYNDAQSYITIPEDKEEQLLDILTEDVDEVFHYDSPDYRG
jgi:hypothetical protein